MRLAQPIVAIDVSQSWFRAADSVAWQRARDRALRQAGDSLLLVGTSVRYGPPPARPQDTATLILRAAELAQLAGRPLHLYSDGEYDDDTAAVRRRLPVGSRIIAEPPRRGSDLAIAGLETPPAATAGDSLRLRVVLLSAASAPRDAELIAAVDGRVLARYALRPFQPFERRFETLGLRLPPGPSVADLRVIVSSVADAEPRNDTARRNIQRGERMVAVAVSTSPDFDFREIVRVLRGSLSLPTIARFRVAPSRWIDDAGRPVAESQVRSDFSRAHVALLHGDTAYFGPPRVATAGALALLPPPNDENEWYLTAALPSPLATTLRALPFDSLPPIAADRAQDGRPLFAARGAPQRLQDIGTLEDAARRVIVLPISGTGRWALRGGASADAFAAMWGTIFAALADRPGRSITPDPVIIAPRELQPQAPVLRSGRTGASAAAGARASLRELPWLYALVAFFLCAEWVLRRRTGLR